MWIYITAPIGGFVVIVGEIITWINFDDKEPCSYHGKPLLTDKELKRWKKRKKQLYRIYKKLYIYIYKQVFEKQFIN